MDRCASRSLLAKLSIFEAFFWKSHADGPLSSCYSIDDVVRFRTSSVIRFTGCRPQAGDETMGFYSDIALS